jgi:hypothetical protein
MDDWERYCPNPRNHAAEQMMQQCNLRDKSLNNRDIDIACVTDVASLHVSEGTSENVVATGPSRTTTIEVPF